MSELLKFACRAPGCGKKLSTQKRLEIHIKSKHPKLFSLLSSPDSTDLNFSKNSIEDIINSQKTKSNMLQPIKKKSIISNENNNIDSIVEKLNIKYNINCLKNDTLFENKNLNNKNTIIRAINEITDDLIFSDENSIFEDYTEIINLDLSKKNINNFENNKNIPFEYFTKMIKLNLSNNNISYALDLKYFINLKILFINCNKLKDISFCEHLVNLEIFKVNSNEIESIESLEKCNKLGMLDISNNKIENVIITLKTFKKLKGLKELNINPNPFIINLFAYKHYFIYKYQNLLKIDGEEINEIDKDISGRFIRENISMYENVKKLNENNSDSQEELDISDNDNEHKIIYKIGNTVISKEMLIPYKSKNKSNNLQKDNKNINENSKIIENNDINNQEIKKENIKMKGIMEQQKKEIDNLKLELENSSIIIKNYESIIFQYKLKYGDINNDKTQENINIFRENKNINKDKKEIESLKKDLEMWKKEIENKDKKEKENKEKMVNNLKRQAKEIEAKRSKEVGGQYVLYKPYINMKINGSIRNYLFMKNYEKFLKEEQKLIDKENMKRKIKMKQVSNEELEIFNNKMDKRREEKKIVIDNKTEKLLEEWDERKKAIPSYVSTFSEIADNEINKRINEIENKKNLRKELNQKKENFSKELKQPHINKDLEQKRLELINSLDPKNKKPVEKDTLKHNKRKGRVILKKPDPSKPSKFSWKLKILNTSENEISIEKALIRKPKQFKISMSMDKTSNKFHDMKVDYLEEIKKKKKDKEPYSKINSTNKIMNEANYAENSAKKWEKLIDKNGNKSLVDNINNARNKIEMLEIQAIQSEKLLTLQKPNSNDVELNKKVSNLIIDSIEAKLSLLRKMK